MVLYVFSLLGYDIIPARNYATFGLCHKNVRWMSEEKERVDRKIEVRTDDNEVNNVW